MSGANVSAFPPGSFGPAEFRCVRCGQCCRWKGLVKVTEEEADSIAAFLNMDPRSFINSLTRLSPDRTTLSLLEKEDGSCYFYDEEARVCRIQPVKPRQCRAFPFTWSFPGWEDVCEGGRLLKKRRQEEKEESGRQ